MVGIPSGLSPPPGFGIITLRTGWGLYVFATRSSRSPASHPSSPSASIVSNVIPSLAVAPSALGVPFHADLGLMAERRRGVLFGAHATPAEARRLHLAHRPPGRHQALHRRAQRRSTSLRLDEAGQAHPRQDQPPR